MEPDAIDRVAASLFAANRRRERFRPLRGADAPATPADAYLVQDRVSRLFETDGAAGPPVGHKIALTSKAVQELCGIDSPAYGVVFSARESPAVVRAPDYQRLGLEFEVAVEIGRDVPAQGAPYDRNSIAGYVAACAPAFELIDDRNADYDDLDAASIIADRCWCAGAVIGKRVTDWRRLDLAAAPAVLTWNGETAERATAGASMGHPLEGLAWIANHLAERGRALAKGDIAITGSAMKTRFPRPGDAAVYSVEGLGEVRIRVEA